MLNQKKMSQDTAAGGWGDRESERGALDGILMGTPAVCKDCADIRVCLQ